MIRGTAFAAWEWGARRKTVAYLNYLEQSQWNSPEETREFQDHRFRQLIRHVHANVPYYSKLMRERGLKPSDFKSIDDIEKLPVLTKELIRENFETLKAKNFSSFKPKFFQSGGTTGRPLQFFKDKEASEKQLAAAYRAWRWAGWDFGIKYAKLWGSTADLRDEKKLKSRIRDSLTASKLLLPCFVMDKATLAEYAVKIRQFAPKVLIGYSNPVYLLARYCESKKIEIKIDAIITTAETLYKHQRKKFEDVFGAEVFDDYGMREASVRATECERHSDYHVAAENGIIEVTRNGKAIRSGLGKILVTDFNNYAFPFIRYENDDVGIPATEMCPCGRGLPTIRTFHGRSHDIFVTSDGKFVPGEIFVYVFLDLIGAEYQVVQKKKGQITISIAKKGGYDAGSLKRCLDHLKQYLPKQKFDVHFVKDIKVPASGKRRFTISEVKLNF